MSNTIDRIPKTLYEANILIKQLQGENSKVSVQNHNLSTSLSKANKLIGHLMSEKQTLENQVKSYEAARATVRKTSIGKL